MKTLMSTMISGLFLSNVLFSCDTLDDDPSNNDTNSFDTGSFSPNICKFPYVYDTLTIDSGFYIRFSEGTIINEEDIAFYDSSTCYFFLTQKLKFTIGSEFYPYSFADFSAFVNTDVIYQGIVYPSTIFNQIIDLYIYSKTFPIFNSDILPITGDLFSKEIINDDRIIETLAENNLLYQGISCTIDSVKISSENDSILICSITFTNHDPVNYYIPDPEKMGVLYYNVIAGFSFTNIATDEHFHLPGYFDSFHWNIPMDHLSLLESNSNLTYTYATKCDHAIISGMYSCHFSIYTSIVSHSITINIPLEQEFGRIWIGYTSAGYTNILID